MKIEKVSFVNKEGFQLSGKLYLPLEEEPRFYAIFAHCFTCSPDQDKKLTRRLVEIGRALDLPVVDHIILTTEGYFSFADEGEL